MIAADCNVVPVTILEKQTGHHSLPLTLRELALLSTNRQLETGTKKKEHIHAAVYNSRNNNAWLASSLACGHVEGHTSLSRDVTLAKRGFLVLYSLGGLAECSTKTDRRVISCFFGAARPNFPGGNIH